MTDFIFLTGSIFYASSHGLITFPKRKRRRMPSLAHGSVTLAAHEGASREPVFLKG
jgi:hypothetical protein